MRTILLAGAAVAALCTGAQAASLAFVPYVSGGSFYAPTTTMQTGLSQQTGSVGNSYTSPFNDSTTLYDTVSADGSASFSGATTGSGSFGVGNDTLSFLWGTPDGFNTLTIFSGADRLVSFTGADVGAGNGTGSYLTTISGLGSYDRVEFTSGQNAFEFAAVSPVPLPAGLPMFGFGLLGLGALALVRQRRTKASQVVS